MTIDKTEFPTELWGTYLEYRRPNFKIYSKRSHALASITSRVMSYGPNKGIMPYCGLYRMNSDTDGWETIAEFEGTEPKSEYEAAIRRLDNKPVISIDF